MTEFTFTAETKDIERKLSGTTLKVKTILRKCYTKANAELIKIAKSNAKSNFKTHNNTNDEHNPPILSTLKKWLGKKDKWSAYVATKTLHGAAQEKGFTATAKNGKYLTFKINGEWKKVTSVTIPAKPFLTPAYNDIYKTGRWKEIFDTTIEKEIQKWWDKQGDK